MSNTAIPATDPLAFIISRSADTLRMGVALLALLIFWVSLDPFAAEISAEQIKANRSGNLINQLGFTGLFVLVVCACVTLVPPAAVIRLLSLPWLIMIALMAYAVVNSTEPDGALRTFFFTCFAMIAAAGVVVLPRSADAFCKLLLLAGGLVLVLSYFGVIVWPEVGVHQSSGTEAQHAGLWRGLYTHKNLAGPIMATLVFAGIYMMRRGQWVAGLLMTLAAFVFVLNTGSRTSTALVPFAVMIVLLPSVLGVRPIGAIMVLGAIIGIHSLTVGTVFVPFFDDILRSFAPEIDFTGRLEIWSFAKDYFYQRPISGFGLDGFWRTEATFAAEQYFDQSWDPRRIVHGHNGYLDIAMEYGVIGLVVAIWVLLLAPALAYVRTVRTRENLLMSDFFLMIVAFTGMNAALESFYFQRADPVWLTLVIALFGLRMTSRFPIISR